LCDVAEKYAAVDLSRRSASGRLYGPRGGGIAEYQGVMHRPTVIQGTLGKALAQSAAMSPVRQR